VAEALLNLRAAPRADAWRQLRAHADSTLEGVTDEVTAMATISALVHHALGCLWTGFYRVAAPRQLLVGPYQGTLGCLTIEFGKGVCGTAAVSGEPVIVDDVLSHANHIACDPRARSEMVVPVFDSRGQLLAVFDIDSEQPGAFSEDDRAGAESLLGWFADNGIVRRGSAG
jgi:L-methionine (R)-S-oxide reductase